MVSKAPVAQLTYTENLTSIKDFAAFVKKGADEAERSGKGLESFKVFAAKNDEGTTLYIAEKARDSGPIKFDRLHRNSFHLRRKTARAAIQDIFTNSIGADLSEQNGDSGKLRFFKHDVRRLMTNVIDNNKVLSDQEKELSKITAVSLQELIPVTKSLASAKELAKWVSEGAAKDMTMYQKAPEPTDSKSTQIPGKFETLRIKRNGKKGKKRFPSFETYGKKFEAKKILGSGSHGIVVLYQEVEGNGKKVVKFSSHFDKSTDRLQSGRVYKQNQTAQKALKYELAAGKKYANEHVVGYTDFMQLENGTIALIGDAVDGGDVFDFMGKVKKAGISPTSRRRIALTLIKDGAKGLKSLHDKGVIHGDMKPENQVLHKGKLKIIDLYTVSEGPELSRLEKDRYAWASTLYNAPEATRIAFFRAVNTAKVDKVMKEATKKYLADAFKLYRGTRHKSPQDRMAGVQEEYKKLFRRAAIAEVSKSEDKIDAKVDIFGLGQTAYEIARGESPGDARRKRAMNDVHGEDDGELLTPTGREKRVGDTAEAKKMALSRNPQAHGVRRGVKKDESTSTPYEDNALLDATYDKVLDPLLDRLESPRPEKRPTADELIKDPALNRPGVGSKEVYALIRLIDQGADRSKIKKAENRLDEKFPELTLDDDEDEYGSFLDKGAVSEGPPSSVKELQQKELPAIAEY